MRKGQRWIVHAILWAWLLTLGLAAWRSTAAAAALFAALVLWETAGALKISRPQPKTLRNREPAALSAPMEPVRDS